MRRIRLYHPTELNAKETTVLAAEPSHHLLQVLRKKVGDTFYVFDDSGAEYQAEIVGVEKKQAVIKTAQATFPEVESPLSVHLGQAISRGDRMDYAIQKAVELGVAKITPLITEFCQVKLSNERFEKKVAHWQSIAVSAAEQCGRTKVPKISLPEKFSDWVLGQNSDVRFICCPRIASENVSSNTKKIQSVVVAVGPEGGFSDEEVNFALNNGFDSLPLGPRVLRTETASVVALTLLQARFGDLIQSPSGSEGIGDSGI